MSIGIECNISNQKMYMYNKVYLSESYIALYLNEEFCFHKYTVHIVLSTIKGQIIFYFPTFEFLIKSAILLIFVYFRSKKGQNCLIIPMCHNCTTIVRFFLRFTLPFFGPFHKNSYDRFWSNVRYCSFPQKFLQEYLRVKSVVTLRQF